MESHMYTVFGSLDPHQYSSFFETEGKKTGEQLPVILEFSLDFTFLSVLGGFVVWT